MVKDFEVGNVVLVHGRYEAVRVVEPILPCTAFPLLTYPLQLDANGFLMSMEEYIPGVPPPMSALIEVYLHILPSLPAAHKVFRSHRR
jgi:hypothetical protein